MGIKGTVRRSTDGHIIHANVDTDIIISEEPEYGKDNRCCASFSILAERSIEGTVHFYPNPLLFGLILECFLVFGLNSL
jgi:hypothetical protein